jgi:hypothetical protein
MKMETTHVSETSTLCIHTPENYPKEDNIRFTITYIFNQYKDYKAKGKAIPLQAWTGQGSRKLKIGT